MSNRHIKMKHLSLFFTVFLSFFSQSLFSFDITTYAHEWIASLPLTTDAHQNELIANLLFWSCERSHTTCMTQKKVLDQLDRTWQQWHFIYATRRNPSRPEMHFIPQVENIEALLDTYQKIGKTYTHCTDYLINQPTISSSLKEKIHELRATCRKVVTEKLLTQWPSFYRLLSEARQTFGEASHQLSKHTLPRKTISDVIATLTLPFAYKSFVHFDLAEIHLTDTCWHTFHASQKIVNTIWELIETERAVFYQTMYNTFVSYYTPGESCFNENGFIPSVSRTLALPPTIVL